MAAILMSQLGNSAAPFFIWRLVDSYLITRNKGSNSSPQLLIPIALVIFFTGVEVAFRSRSKRSNAVSKHLLHD